MVQKNGIHADLVVSNKATRLILLLLCASSFRTYPIGHNLTNSTVWMWNREKNLTHCSMRKHYSAAECPRFMVYLTDFANARTKSEDSDYMLHRTKVEAKTINSGSGFEKSSTSDGDKSGTEIPTVMAVSATDEPHVGVYRYQATRMVRNNAR